jgi:hypothetical protein
LKFLWSKRGLEVPLIQTGPKPARYLLHFARQLFISSHNSQASSTWSLFPFWKSQTLI